MAKDGFALDVLKPSLVDPFHTAHAMYLTLQPLIYQKALIQHSSCPVLQCGLYRFEHRFVHARNYVIVAVNGCLNILRYMSCPLCGFIIWEEEDEGVL